MISKRRPLLLRRLWVACGLLFTLSLVRLIAAGLKDVFFFQSLVFMVLVAAIAGVSSFMLIKFANPFEVMLPVIFVISVILFDNLVIGSLESAIDKLPLIFALILIYFIIMEKGFPGYSFVSFAFLILYVTFKSLETGSAAVIICYMALIVAQSINIFLPKKKKKTLVPQPSQKPNLLHHVFDVAFPGLVFFLRLKPNTELELSFVNNKAKNTYKINNMSDFLDFLEGISFTRGQAAGKVDENLLNSILPKKSLKEEIFIKMKEILINSTIEKETNFICFHAKRNLQLRVSMTSFFQESRKEVLLFIDDNQLEEDYFALKELDERKDKMLIAITHDLRSPLNGILAFINLSKNEKNDESRNKKLTYAEINGNLLMSLIEDILDFQSIAQNKFSLKGEEFNLFAVVDQVVDLITMQTKEKNIHFQVDTNFKRNQPIMLFSDSRRLRQILLNLLTNSIKFTINGGKLRLNILGTTNTNIIKFEVLDSGIGMKPEIIERLGEPFSTFDTNGLNKYGIGFGIYLCKKLSTLLGPKENNFHISSIYGKGTKIGFLAYQRVQDLDSQTISCKRLFFNQFSEHSFNKTLNPELEMRFVKSSSKASNSSNSKDMLKRSQFSKQINSLHDFEGVANEAWPFEKRLSNLNSKRMMTELILRKEISKELNVNNSYRIRSPEGDSSVRLCLGNTNTFNNYEEGAAFNKAKTTAFNFELSKQISHLQLTNFNKKIRGSVEEFSNKFSKKDYLLSYDESLEFVSFSEEELNKNCFFDKIMEDEELSNNELEKNVDMDQYKFEPKASPLNIVNIPSLNNTESRVLQKKVNKMRMSGSIENISRHLLINLKICHVLIVDDDLFNLMVLHEFLKKIQGVDLNIEKASNGAECLKMFKNANKMQDFCNIEIIFMDCYMPIMDGFQTAKEIKRLIKEENFAETKIIAVSGLSGLDEETKCRESGMDDFITKPVSEKEFTEFFTFYMHDFMNE